MHTLKLPLFTFVVGIFALVAFAACGDDDGGGIPPAGTYQFDVTGTVEVEFPAEGASAAPVALLQTQTGSVSGGLSIQFNDDGSFTIPELNLSVTVEENSITFGSTLDQPSIGQTGSDGTRIDLIAQVQFPDGAVGHNVNPLPLESGGTLSLDSPLTLNPPPDFGGVPFTDEGGIIILNVTDSELILAPVPGQDTTESATTEIMLPPDVDATLGLLGVQPDQYGNVVIADDPAADWIYGNPNASPGFTPGYTDILTTFSGKLIVSEDQVNILNAMFPCNASFGDNQVVCPPGAGPLPPGELYFFGEFLNGAVPADPDHICTYATVFDSGNPWMLIEPFGFDFYQGAGLWNELTGGLGQPWDLVVSRVDEQQIAVEADSSAHALILRDTSVILFVFPADELSGAAGWRITADCHNDTFEASQSGGDVPGPNPTGDFLPLPIDGFEPAPPICDTSAFATCP